MASDQSMNEVFTRFSELLQTRLNKGIITTEDSVRYTLFASLLERGIAPEDVILEYPHPSIPRAQVDTLLPSFNGHTVAIEFKYDRDPPGGKNQPKTQKAAYVFKDLHRLVLLGKGIEAECFFVYLTTEEMSVYFTNPNNGHADFFNLLLSGSLEIPRDYFSGKPMTFLKALGGEFEAKVSAIVSRTLLRGTRCVFTRFSLLALKEKG